MNYNKKFGFYDPKTKKAQVYDGSKRTPTNTVVNGRVGFSIPKSLTVNARKRSLTN